MTSSCYQSIGVRHPYGSMIGSDIQSWTPPASSDSSSDRTIVVSDDSDKEEDDNDEDDKEGDDNEGSDDSNNALPVSWPGITLSGRQYAILTSASLVDTFLLSTRSSRFLPSSLQQSAAQVVDDHRALIKATTSKKKPLWKNVPLWSPLYHQVRRTDSATSTARLVKTIQRQSIFQKSR